MTITYRSVKGSNLTPAEVDANFTDLVAQVAAALANTAVTPGVYLNANVTVNARGQVTAAASGSGGGFDPFLLMGA